MTQADFDANIVALASLIGLPPIHAGDQHVTEAVGVVQGITHGCHDSIGARPLLPLWRAQNGVARVEVRTEPPHRPRWPRLPRW